MPKAPAPNETLPTAPEPVARVAVEADVRSRRRPEWVFDGLPAEMYHAQGDLGAVLVRRYESLCFSGIWTTEKQSAKRLAQARKRLFSRIGI